MFFFHNEEKNHPKLERTEALVRGHCQSTGVQEAIAKHDGPDSLSCIHLRKSKGVQEAIAKHDGPDSLSCIRLRKSITHSKEANV